LAAMRLFRPSRQRSSARSSTPRLKGPYDPVLEYMLS
jgi:hypothetical protein